MSYGTVNADVIGTSVAGSNIGAGNASIMKNRIINGAMVISQRNGTSSVSNPNQYVLDRFYSASLTATNAVQQSTTAPTGFTNSYYYNVGATTGNPAAANNVYLSQVIEANNVSDFGIGTVNASTVTVSFWVRASVTGTYCLALTNGGANNNSTAATRSYVTTYSISSANTWTQITKTITLDTSGTWNNSGNGIGLTCIFDLGSGSNRQTSTLNAWQTGDYCSNSSQVNINATANATFYITGVQLEVGSSATGYEYRQYGQELALCLRYYYYQVIPNGNFGGTIGANQTTTVSWFPIQNVFRATPTATYSGALSVIQGNSQSNVTSVAALHYAQNAVNVALTCGAILTAGYSTNLYANGSTSYLNLSAEL